MNIELLESRIAPASLINPSVVTYQDVDGDEVTVNFSKPILTSLAVADDLFDFASGTITNGPGGNGAPQQLRLIDLAALADIHVADGMGITVTAKRSAVTGGDGFANIGAIDAAGINLGAVSVDGDLGQIDAGAAANPASTPGLKGLTVQSMGMLGTSTQAGGDLISSISGALGKLTVKGDLRGEDFEITGALGSAKIAGSIIGTATANSGKLHAATFGKITVGADLVAVGGTGSGSIVGAGKSVLIGGSVIALGNGVNSGKISGAASVTIHGDLIGGGGNDSGAVVGASKVVIDADVRGGDGMRSGAVEITKGLLLLRGSVVGGDGADSGEIRVLGTNGAKSAVTIGGSIVGVGANSGVVSVLSGASLKTLTIGGDIIGGAGVESGIVKTAPGSDIDTLKVAGDVRGGEAADAGAIITGDGNAVDQGSDIGQLLVGGGFVGSTVAGSGHIFISGSVKTMSFGGSILGWTADDTGRLEVTGSIGSISIGDSIEAIGGKNAGVVKAGGDIGKVTIKHDIIGSGESSAQLLSGGTITSIFIGGSIIGGPEDFTSRIVAAGDIVSLTVGHDIDSGAGALSGSVASGKAIGTMLVKGSLIGNPTSKLRIFALESSAPTDTTNIAIGKLTVNGRVEFAQIEAGYTSDGTAANVDAQIGAVTIGRDWIASDLVAGAVDGGGGFGNANDTPITTDPSNDANTFSRIASIVIKGHALGTVGGADHFGFVAQQLVSLKVGDATLLFTDPTAVESFAVGPTPDLNAREV